MQASFTLGHVRGISIGIHSTWLIVFGLLTYSLAEGVLPNQYHGWSTAMYWIIGAISALLLFASVLAHELGHSLTALSKGVKVKSIVLFIFGGVAQLEDETDTASDEFWIAIAGPAVSVVIGVLSALIFLAVRGVSEEIGAIFAYLATANIILVLFNLIPGFPLDGGRVFRAVLWGATDNLQRATRIASTVGMVVGYIFIVLGIFLVFQNPISGIWIIAIGWFLRSAAEQSYQQLMMERAFSGVRVNELMTRDPVTVAPDVPLDRLVSDYVMARNVRGLPVMQNGDLVGIITLNDIKDVPQHDWPARTVGEVMTPRDKLVTATPTTSLKTVVKAMSDNDIHQLPVLQDGKLVGLLTRNAVIRALQLQQELGGPSTRGQTPTGAAANRQQIGAR
jgi:Zn-dependent protease/CBS domain-containing protein